MLTGDVQVAHETPTGRILVTDSLTFCDARIGGRDVLVAGSFAGRVALGFALPFGLRALIAHAAGVGKDGAGIGGLAVGDEHGVPAAAVETMSARLGDGASVLEDGVIGYVNQTARDLGVQAGMAAREAAHRLLDAPPGRAAPAVTLVDRSQRVVMETPEGRVVLVTSMSFATPQNRRDVLCAGSHGGRVNTRNVVVVRPRGAIVYDGGLAKERSGVDGLPVLDAAGVAAAAVDVASARIGDPASLYETGVISTVNGAARRAGVEVGQLAREAAPRMLASRKEPP